MAIDENLHVIASIQIDAARERVWRVLTDPESIKLYFFGAETLTDWKVGSEIVFQGNFEGQRWQDKGRVLKVDRNSLLSYSYWSGFCGLEDLPENYGTVAYLLEDNGNKTTLTVTQRGYANEESKVNSKNGWERILGQIKVIAEGSA